MNYEWYLNMIKKENANLRDERQYTTVDALYSCSSFQNKPHVASTDAASSSRQTQSV